MAERYHSVDVIALVVLYAGSSFFFIVKQWLINLAASKLGGASDGVDGVLGCLEAGLILTHDWHGFNELLAGDLHECGKGPGAETKTDSSDVHAESDRSCREEFAQSRVADHEELHVKLAEEDNPEPPVLEWLMEDVEVRSVPLLLSLLINCALLDGWGINRHGIKDSAVEHVEEVHHDEALEHEGLVLHSPGWNCGITKFNVQLRAEEVVGDVSDNRASIHEDKHGDNLVDRLREDGAHHRLRDQRILHADTFLADFGRVRSFSCKGNGSEHVHNQVDPEELNNDEGRVAEDDSSGENEGHAGDIHGHLELNELTDVVLEVAAPADSSDDGEEVIVHEDNVGVVLGSGAAILSKGEANISFREGTGIAETFTSDTDGRTGLA